MSVDPKIEEVEGRLAVTKAVTPELAAQLESAERVMRRRHKMLTALARCVGVAPPRP